MEESDKSNNEKVSSSQEIASPSDTIEGTPTKPIDTSQILFPESPVYEPEEDMEDIQQNVEGVTSTTEIKAKEQQDVKDPPSQVKRKLSDEPLCSDAKIQKIDLASAECVSTQNLDDEVSEIIGGAAKRKFDVELPSTSRVRTPVKSSPRKVTKRSNSADVAKPKTPKTPKSRPASVDITKTRTPRTRTPRQQRLQLEQIGEQTTSEGTNTSDTNSRASVVFVKEIPPPQQNPVEIIAEESNSELNDSQSFHLVLSPTPDEDVSDDKTKPHYSSDPVIVKDRKEILEPGKVHETHSEGYNYSDQSNNLSQPMPKDYNKGKSTDQDSTDSLNSINLESPDHVPSVASKMISKLSNGNSSTPTEISVPGKHGLSEDSDSTPDLIKLNGNKAKRLKNESFRASNTTTPSTISPLQNGHSLPVNTPQVPIFDIHISQNEDCEFLSLYVVRTDNDLGMDMCKEFQRISKRFTIDPYMADVSVSNSPSSVTSGGMINLPNRTSFASVVSSTSTTSSNRTSDGAFVVPQPPRKSVSNPSTTVKGYDALMKKLQDIFSHIRETSIDDGNRSMNEDKVSVAVQTSLSSDTASLSNGNASPDEVGKCDKATPKSSLKKTRVRGRRHIAGKTKRAILPTQHEEIEEAQAAISPERLPSNGENGKMSPLKSPKEEKPLSSLVGTPKSVTKLKQKRRPTSPRPATPVDKVVVKTEYPGFPPDTVVLAKWVDKRYYSGKVLEITEPNKYSIKFDDGHSKVLLDDFIIFGDMKRLPLRGQSVYAMVDDEQNYEPGLVLEVEENASGTVTYRCITDGESQVCVTASELYLTEDQARALKESSRPRSPPAPHPTTPRRRHHTELDLDNIIQGPRSARSRDKGSSSAKKRIASPKSPKASTSGVKSKSTPVSRKRLASESSEMSESSNSAPPVRIEDVAGVEPEVQRTPRKIDGVKAGPLQLKGAAKQNIGKKNSKLAKFENDEDTVSLLGPIPSTDCTIFSGLHFLLTCNEVPRSRDTDEKSTEKSQDTRHYSSEEDGDTTSTMATDTEDFEFCNRPFNKERLKEQIEAGGGVVYSHFDDVPKAKYSACKLIAPRPCTTAKYIQCLSVDIRAVSHAWIIFSCINNRLMDVDSYVLPAGWSLIKKRYMNWSPSTGKRNTTIFKDKVILICHDQDNFVKFWDRVCTLAGATTRVVNEENLNTNSAHALVTDWDCPHEVQNKANQDMIPLVSPHWVKQCLIEGKILPTDGHDKFSFMYTEPE
ncbi:uncharacterized protein LOC113510779 isoform X2 [Galleria mellonella]|uniref:Uncharacterized protein LOC113510779 isoform X2 n=1 Tax=Galleria mellonella TaxID=7137 RepID=A0ABM3N4B0_GALME|nr:uncharacterized protein LOC113510779 isoform X2 [Galleria mellonella]